MVVSRVPWLLVVALLMGCADEDVAEPIVNGGDPPCAPHELALGDGSCVAVGVPPGGCGEGFDHDGEHGCEPILPEEACPPGFTAVPGDTACHEVAPCAAGTWGDIPTDPTTEHVDSGYTGGNNNGNAQQPWTTIQQAVDAAVPNAIIAIAAGSYIEDIMVVAKPVKLWGRCPQLVEIIAAGNDVAAIYVERAHFAEVRDLAVRGPGVGVLVTGAQDVIIDRLWVHDTSWRGIDVEATRGPTRVSITGSLVEHSTEDAIYVSGSELSVASTELRDTELGVLGLSARGISAQVNPNNMQPALLTVSGSLISDNREYGVFVSSSQATIDSTVVRRTTDTSGPARAIGMQRNPDNQPGQVEVTRSVVEQTRGAGIAALGLPMHIEATVVRDTEADARDLIARGILLQRVQETGESGELTLQSSLVERAHEFGVMVYGASATIASSVIRSTLLTPNDAFGDGVAVVSDMIPGSANITTSLVTQSARAALSSHGASIAVQSSRFRCQELDFSSTPFQDVDAVWSDDGDALCGCPTATEACKVLSQLPDPPSAL